LMPMTELSGRMDLSHGQRVHALADRVLGIKSGRGASPPSTKPPSSLLCTCACATDTTGGASTAAHAHVCVCMQLTTVVHQLASVTRERDDLVRRVKELSTRLADCEAAAASIRTTQVGGLCVSIPLCPAHVCPSLCALPVCVPQHHDGCVPWRLTHTRPLKQQRGKTTPPSLNWHAARPRMRSPAMHGCAGGAGRMQDCLFFSVAGGTGLLKFCALGCIPMCC